MLRIFQAIFVIALMLAMRRRPRSRESLSSIPPTFATHTTTRTITTIWPVCSL